MNYMQPARLSDSELYKLCQFYGLNAKTWLRKFAGLLPEVFKRSLHRRRGCASIHEFAKKLAGMNERTVDKILNLHKRLQDKPALLNLLESGEQGWSKLEKVAFLASKENDQELAEQVSSLPRAALEEFVKNTRNELTPGSQVENISQTLQARHKPEVFSIHISKKSRQKLDLMKHTMEKRYRKTLTWDEVFKAWPIEPQKTIIQSVCPDCAAKKAQQKRKRPIPQAIQKLVFATHGFTCAYPHCNKPYQELHHVYPWAKYKTHDPKQIYPLCKTHHTLAHAGFIANMEKAPENWQIRKSPWQSAIDKKAISHQLKY